MPITKQEEYDNTVLALNLIKDYEYEAKVVQYREKLDDPRTFEEITQYYHLGTTGYIASSGYKALLQAYSILYNDNSQEINKALHALNSMYAQTFIVRNIASIIDNNEHIDKVKEKYTRHITKNLFKDLEQNNYCILGNNLIGGQHFTVIKFSKENNKYYYTLYNSGSGASEENDKVLDSKVQEIKEQIGAISQDKEIEQSIKKHQLTRLTKEYLLHLSKQNEIDKDLYSTIRYEIVSPVLVKAILQVTVQHNLEYESLKSKDKGEAIRQKELQNKNQYLKNPKIINTSKTFGQKLSNCPTRSTREFLREVLPQFQNIYDFIVRNSVEDIVSMLENNRKILGYALGISEKDIANNNQIYDTDNQYSIIQHEINRRLHRPIDNKVNFLYKNEKIFVYDKQAKQTEVARQNAKHIVNTDVLFYNDLGELCYDLGVSAHVNDGLSITSKATLLDITAFLLALQNTDNNSELLLLKDFCFHILTNLFPTDDVTLPITRDLLAPIIEDLEQQLIQQGIIKKTDNVTSTVDKSLCNEEQERRIVDNLLKKNINNTDIHPILVAQLQAKIINLASEKNKSGHEENNGYMYAHRLLPQIETQRRVKKELGTEPVLLDTANIAQAKTMVEKVLAKRQNAIVKR